MNNTENSQFDPHRRDLLAQAKTVITEVDTADAASRIERGVVVLDVTLTPELEREGTARDLVRLVQEARRGAGLAVSDRVHLTVRGSDDWIGALEAHRDFVLGETLAVAVSTEVVAGEVPEIEVRRA